MSHFLRWSCCALACSLAIALSSAECSAQGKQIAFRDGHRRHQPVYDYMPTDGGTPQGMGYWGPVNCGANCGPGCAGGDCANGECGGGDCGCGGCDGSCGCGPDCNCGTGGCGSGDCGCGDCGSGGMGCGGCDMGCASCDTGCGNCEIGCGPCDEYCDVECCPQQCGPRCIVYGDFLYLQVTDVDVAHAQQQDGLGGAGTVPFGEIGTIGHDFNPGFRVGGSVACSPCTSVGMSFTHFESDSSSSLEAPDVPGGGGAIGSLVHHPGAALTASAGPVDATYAVNFELADVMCRRVWKECSNYSLAYSLGAQYGHLEQDFSQNGIFGGGLGGAIDTETEIDFDGGGIKVGVDGEHRFGHGLGVYGRLTAAAMTGRFSSHYSMFNESTDQMLAMADWKDDRVIGQIEYEVGISCVSKCGHWRTAAGYMFSYWTNTVTTPEFIDAVQADNYTSVGDTLGFNGLVGRVECRW